MSTNGKGSQPIWLIFQMQQNLKFYWNDIRIKLWRLQNYWSSNIRGSKAITGVLDISKFIGTSPLLLNRDMYIFYIGLRWG